MTRNEQEYSEQGDEWVPSPADECEEFKYATPVGARGDVLVYRQRWDISGRLTDFAVILMTRLDGKPVCAAEVDARHGKLHVHVYNQLGHRIGRDNFEAVATQQDLEKAYDAAVDLMEEKWEDYKRRWRNG